jgi:hypothetical protein
VKCPRIPTTRPPLAGYIVERVSGLSYDDYVERNIFTPLGMTQATFRQPLPARLEPFMSQGYGPGLSKPEKFEFVVPAPAGSQAASGAAMARFMIAHLNDGAGLMKPETARQMHDFVLPILPPLHPMALGFYHDDINGRRVIGHAGDTVYMHTNLDLFIDDGVGLFISMNSDGKAGSPRWVREGLLRRFADRYFPAPLEGTPIDAKTAREHARMLAGSYASSRGFETELPAHARSRRAGEGRARRGRRDRRRQRRQRRRPAAQVDRGRAVRVARPRQRHAPRRRGQGRPGHPVELRYREPVHIPAPRTVVQGRGMVASGCPRSAWDRVAVRARLADRRDRAAPLQGRRQVSGQAAAQPARSSRRAVAGAAGGRVGDLVHVGWAALDAGRTTRSAALRVADPQPDRSCSACSCWPRGTCGRRARRSAAGSRCVWGVLLVLAAVILLWVALAFHMFGFGTHY